MFGFMKSFVGVKGSQFAQDVVAGIVSLDPEAATLAQLDQMEQDLDKAGDLIQKLRAEYDREVREAEAASAKYNQLLAAAEVLQRRIDGGDSSVEASLTKLVNQLEELEPTVAAEQRDVVDAKALLDQAQIAYHEKAAAITTAKQTMERAKRDMQRSELELEKAKEKSERAAQVAGLRQTSTNGLNVATDAMQRRADEARAKTEAAKLKASTLSGMADPVGGDANIAAALREVKTGVNTTNTSLADRLAKLRK